MPRAAQGAHKRPHARAHASIAGRPPTCSSAASTRRLSLGRRHARRPSASVSPLPGASAVPPPSLDCAASWCVTACGSASSGSSASPWPCRPPSCCCTSDLRRACPAAGAAVGPRCCCPASQLLELCCSNSAASSSAGMPPGRRRRSRPRTPSQLAAPSRCASSSCDACCCRRRQRVTATLPAAAATPTAAAASRAGAALLLLLLPPGTAGWAASPPGAPGRPWLGMGSCSGPAEGRDSDSCGMASAVHAGSSAGTDVLLTSLQGRPVSVHQRSMSGLPSKQRQLACHNSRAAPLAAPALTASSGCGQRAPRTTRAECAPARPSPPGPCSGCRAAAVSAGGPCGRRAVARGGRQQRSAPHSQFPQPRPGQRGGQAAAQAWVAMQRQVSHICWPGWGHPGGWKCGARQLVAAQIQDQGALQAGGQEGGSTARVRAAAAGQQAGWGLRSAATHVLRCAVQQHMQNPPCAPCSPPTRQGAAR